MRMPVDDTLSDDLFSREYWDGLEAIGGFVIPLHELDREGHDRDVHSVGETPDVRPKSSRSLLRLPHRTMVDPDLPCPTTLIGPEFLLGDDLMPTLRYYG